MESLADKHACANLKLGIHLAVYVLPYHRRKLCIEKDSNSADAVTTAYNYVF